MIRVAAGILQRDGRILICQREGRGPHALKWEFPGGKLKEGESAEAALCRELREELGVTILPSRLRVLDTIRHRYPGGPEVEIHFFQVAEFSGEPANLSFHRIAWVASGDLCGYDFLDADRPLVARIEAGGVLCGDGSPHGGASRRTTLEIDPVHLDRRAAYKLMISVIVPRPIALVSTVSAEGRANLAPFSFFNGISSQPPIVMLAVGGRRTGRKDTWNNIEATGEFVVNVVVPEIVDAMVIASGDYPPDVDEIELTRLTRVPSRRVRPPRIGESPVQMECRLEKLLEVAGTAVILGRVLLYHVRDDLLEGGAVDPSRLRPIARLGGELYSRLGEIFEKPRPR